MSDKTILPITELNKYREMLSGLASSAEKSDSLTHCDTGTWNLLDPRTPHGKQIYNSYTDGELLTFVRCAAERLGRPPNSAEVYCVYMRYLRRRFGSWPDILRAAGLGDKPVIDKSHIAGMLDNAGETELRHLFVIFSARELPEHNPTKRLAKAAASELLPHFKTRDNIEIAVTILEEREDNKCAADIAQTGEDNELLRIVRESGRMLGRTPLRVELPEDTAFRLWRRFGSWRGALMKAGLVPLSGDVLGRAQAEYALKTASPDNIGKDLTPDMRGDLQQMCDLARELGRAPVKGESPEAVFRRVNKEFGSYRAVIGYMGIPALDKREERRLISDAFGKKTGNTSSF